MRSDLVGIFFDDSPKKTAGGRVERIRPLAKIPQTGWKHPAEFPNLFHEKILGVDIESFDPELKTHGPGWARGVGHIVGVSVAVKDNSWYFPIRHEINPEDNMDTELVFRYLKDLLTLPMDKVGANILYDKAWLREEGIYMKGMLYDIQYAEALLDDTSMDYSLDTIAKKYLGEGKESSDLYNWCSLSYGGPSTGEQRKNIYRSPPCLVGPYAETDAFHPVQILNKQYKKLKALNLWDLFEMECKLIPVLEGMRFRGLPINLEQAEKVESELQAQEISLQKELDDRAGFPVGININNDLKKLFDKFHIKYPYTAKGNASFTQKFLTTNGSKPAQAINSIRQLGKARVSFVRNAILDKHIAGKVYPSFHPLRGEYGGAVSGRYSSSMPNAQQIPARHPVLAPLIRSLFVPEEGFPNWIKLDLSQIEYRFFAHYSGDKKLIQEYQDLDTDYHDIVSGFLDHSLIRKIVKNFNFMSLYGGGKDKTMGMIGEALSEKQIKEMLIKFDLPYTEDNALPILATHFIDLYAENFPAAKRVMQECSEYADITGEIRTILGRRSSFNLWESSYRRYSKPLEYGEAFKTYGSNIRRAGTYKALNRKLQGSAADLLKKGMLDAYEAGLFNQNRLGFPHVTVHDELDFSYHPDLNKDFKELKNIIENCIPLKVPVIMDTEIGNNWGDVKKYIL